MEGDPQAGTIVDTIITMAQGMKVVTVAEGVETIEQMGLLSRKGCDRLQGYWFSPPQPGEQLMQLLDSPDHHRFLHQAR